MKTIRQDRAYYEASGGGVTISGGEPLLQPEFTKRILRQCKEEGINTCLESTFCMDWGRIEPVLPYADLLITDIKHMDPGEHQRYTGVSNERILKNLKRLSHEEKELIIRIPVIPGVNHTKKKQGTDSGFYSQRNEESNTASAASRFYASWRRKIRVPGAGISNGKPEI